MHFDISFRTPGSLCRGRNVTILKQIDFGESPDPAEADFKFSVNVPILAFRHFHLDHSELMPEFKLHVASDFDSILIPGHQKI